MSDRGLAAELPGLRLSVLELADRLLDRGTVVSGEATISVAGVDLIYLGLNVALTSVENLRRSAVVTPRPASSGTVAGKPLQRPVISTGEAPAPSTSLVREAPLGLANATNAARPVLAEEGASADSRQLTADNRTLAGALPSLVDIDPENAERGLAKLVLALIELLRQLLERQGVRRMEGGGLSDDEIERMGVAFMRLEERMREMLRQFGLEPEDLNLELGPLGDLL